ncbi:hypothetical protein HYT58_00925 [Candidatus Woesearchaeota archaeon]|nr:hypothetical protein [Candidatus Woesearchaeota archaeon]
MKVIIDALLEIKKAFSLIKIFNVLLDTFLIFSAIFLILSLIMVTWIFALVPAVVYCALKFHRLSRKNEFREVERRVPVLNEQLRTVADNIDRENPIIESLHKEVLGKMKQVRVSSFIDQKRMFAKTIALAFVSFIAVLVSFNNVVFLDFNELVFETIDKAKELTGKDRDDKFDEFEDIYGYRPRDIYGDASVAELGTEELLLKIQPLASEIDISDVKDAEKHEFGGEFPKDIYATSDASYGDDIPKEHQEVVKRYFSDITKGESS